MDLAVSPQKQTCRPCSPTLQMQGSSLKSCWIDVIGEWLPLIMVPFMEESGGSMICHPDISFRLFSSGQSFRANGVNLLTFFFLPNFGGGLGIGQNPFGGRSRLCGHLPYFWGPTLRDLGEQSCSVTPRLSLCFIPRWQDITEACTQAGPQDMHPRFSSACRLEDGFHWPTGRLPSAWIYVPCCTNGPKTATNKAVASFSPSHLCLDLSVSPFPLAPQPLLLGLQDGLLLGENSRAVVLLRSRFFLL